MGRTRRVSAAGAAAVMVAVGLAAAPAIADSPPQPGPVPISAVTQTRVTLTFTGDGCKGCVISPEQLIYASDNGGQEASWSGKDRKVRGDSVTFLVPTESTRGLMFYIDAPESESAPGVRATSARPAERAAVSATSVVLDCLTPPS